jgi:hypothetical protein
MMNARNLAEEMAARSASAACLAEWGSLADDGMMLHVGRAMGRQLGFSDLLRLRKEARDAL